jgi:hypothetical protein
MILTRLFLRAKQGLGFSPDKVFSHNELDPEVLIAISLDGLYSSN